MAINWGKSFWRDQTEGVMAWINIGLFSVFVVLIVASWVMRQEFGGELSLNLAAETAGVWVAVVLINEVIRRDQEKRALPARAAALWRIRKIHDKISGFWVLLVFRGARVDGMRQVILDENNMQLFDERLARVINQIDLSSDAPTFSKKPIGTVVSAQASAIQRNIELVTQGYAQYLSPEMLAALGRVEDNDFIAGLTDDLDQELHEMESSYYLNSDGTRQKRRPKMLDVIGERWHENFIPAINELGRVIVAELPAVSDAGDDPAPSDGRLRMSVGSKPPKAADFDPECKDRLEDIRFYLSTELDKPSQDTEASDD